MMTWSDQGPVYQTSAGLEVPVIGSLEQLVRDAKTGTYDAIYIALPMRAENKIKALIDSAQR